MKVEIALGPTGVGVSSALLGRDCATLSCPLQMLSFMCAHLAFFHQGYDLFSELGPYMKELGAQVTRGEGGCSREEEAGVPSEGSLLARGSAGGDQPRGDRGRPEGSVSLGCQSGSPFLHPMQPEAKRAPLLSHPVEDLTVGEA